MIADRYQYTFTTKKGEQKTITSKKQNMMYRIRIEVDNFHANTSLFSIQEKETSQFELAEDVTVDLVEGVKNVKISLFGVYARPHAQQFKILNEIGYEEEIGTYILNTDIIQSGVLGGDLHRLSFILNSQLLS